MEIVCEQCVAWQKSKAEVTFSNEADALKHVVRAHGNRAGEMLVKLWPLFPMGGLEWLLRDVHAGSKNAA